MNFFKRLLRQSDDNLTEQANILVSVAKMHAISSFIPTSDHFKSLLDTNPKDWDFVITVAGVFIAATRLNSLRLDSKKEEALMNIVAQKLTEWDRDGINAFEDCKRLFEIEYDRLEAMTEYQKDNRFLAADALGVWIVLNIFKNPPKTDQEFSLVRVTGSMVTHTFFNWWTK